ncbi:hypothetical protein [uncultured Brevundimonas sp.]|uniref:hypothetical protein n=1 Tax=uncultured Brevundimonas sp. TaxID=213418 RepID=UPI0025E6A547|nr:hypothetical protein [uncultured Brevundimonas sp.]
MRSHLSLTAILGIPLVLLGLSLTGLVGALLFDGAWDLAFSGMVGVVIVTIVWAWTRAYRKGWTRPSR